MSDITAIAFCNHQRN